jgi:hypothetical protein
MKIAELCSKQTQFFLTEQRHPWPSAGIFPSHSHATMSFST